MNEMQDWLIELRFYVPRDTKQVILETFFPANPSVSTFRKLNGAMPQGSWLGPLAFLVLFDDLCTGCPLHKYVDDTTLSELVQPKQPDTHMSTYLAHYTYMGSSQWNGN